ncbi:MAG TPA: hypothetical protein VNW29_02215, partial [Candidatus Sulfotelmatobacter sp.]|nr:hypothetical protein [Candidatus Sulfotelmatobacter sp.]
MNKKYLYIGFIIILLVSGFVIWKTIHHAQQSTSTSQKSIRRALPKEVTVTLNKDGFIPQVVTINTGSAVRWKNESGSQQTVNSDNYPTNQLHRELNFGVFSNGSSVTYTFTKT